MFKSIGCTQKAYQESKRELWVFDEVEITIDEWPFLEPFVEVEGISEEIVKSISEKLNFDWQEAIFGAAGKVYNKKYGIEEEKVNTMPELVFKMKNPFV